MQSSQIGQVVVLPRVDVNEFVDVIVGTKEVDMLLVVEGRLVAIDRRSCRGRRCAGQWGEVVMAP
jgi:hypothetical protein